MQVQPNTPQAQSPTLLSEELIPSVRGEFYSYSTRFTTKRPLGCLMKCKANKDRPLTFAEDHVDELDLVFTFGDHVRICSPLTKPAIELLGELVAASELNKTWIARLNITQDGFNKLRQQKDGKALAAICNTAITHDEGVIPLSSGMILAVTTESGKFGLLLVREITPTSVSVDACHILL